ncbi:unnamed protein product (macronuclear) [Paramecium tetraurelia]|uniref:Uncharacterized protein n=1 Tax=Paramecium tetraurelia TaxID=5888 RepID=A0D4Y4_PARTE|nr:uncharacterized protein GSPATT00013548001 [Paramecium tetraurelia]CAK78101.1 unnamed protein product [Paramecium tetraurelia]|eukprot:XP_001445498.1 hypothetical protein (macronuclear) [Paramecium tetraurelia strain d4-2]
MNQNIQVCRMIDSPESIICNKHNEKVEFVLLNNDIHGNDKLLCKGCFYEFSGVKQVYSIFEAANKLQEMKNLEYQGQKAMILDQLQQIIIHIEDMITFQGSFQQYASNILEVMNNWKLELGNKLIAISQYKFQDELDRFNDSTLTSKNDDQILQFIQQSKWQYSEKIQNNLTNIQLLTTNNQTFLNLLEFVKKQQEFESVQRLNQQSYYSDRFDSLFIAREDSNGPRVIFQSQNQPDHDMKISLKLSQTFPQKDTVLSISFSHDDSLLASACNNEIKLWQFQDGKVCDCIGTLEGHTQQIFTLAFSKNKNWLFSAGKDMSIILWKPKIFLFNFIITTKQQQLNAHKDYILQLILNNKENQLISCSSDTKISIWSVNYRQNTIQFQQSLERHGGPVISICLNQSNNLLVSSGLDRQIIVWSQNNNKEWVFQQVISKLTNDFGYRISFISDVSIVWQSFKMGLTHIFKQEDGTFKELLDYRIQLSKKAENDGDYSFPSIFNSNKQILIQKHCNRIHFLTLNSQTQLKVQQEQIILNNQQSYGNLSNDGKYLVLWCDQKFLLYEICYE